MKMKRSSFFPKVNRNPGTEINYSAGYLAQMIPIVDEHFLAPLKLHAQAPSLITCFTIRISRLLETFTSSTSINQNEPFTGWRIRNYEVDRWYEKSFPGSYGTQIDHFSTLRRKFGEIPLYYSKLNFDDSKNWNWTVAFSYLMAIRELSENITFTKFPEILHPFTTNYLRAFSALLTAILLYCC